MQMNALLALHFKESPDEWDDEKWASKWAQFKFSIDWENKRWQSKV